MEAKCETMSGINFTNLTYEEIPPDEVWKISVLSDHLKMRAGRLEANLSNEEIRIMIDAVST